MEKNEYVIYAALLVFITQKNTVRSMINDKDTDSCVLYLLMAMAMMTGSQPE